MKQLLKRFDELRIAVVGDVILDRYTWGSVSRISPEAPVPVVRSKRRSNKVGGAGNAAQTVAALGARVTLFGRVGEDAPGDLLRRKMREHDLEFEPLPNEADRPTTVKTRIIAENQQLLRIDEEDRTEISTSSLNQQIDRLHGLLEPHDAVLVSDYAKGVFSPDSLPTWFELFSGLDLPVVVDPHVRHFTHYRGARVLTPNERELREGMGETGTGNAPLDEVSRRAMEQLELPALLVTRGEEGMVLLENGNEPFELRAEAREVYDVTGAGDTVAGVVTLGEALGARRRSTVKLANTAAGQVVARMGAVAIGSDELMKVLES